MKLNLRKNFLICGGMPRSATTFLYTEISNYENVFSSKIKEAHLFFRSDCFIDFKLRNLGVDKIYLDFTPLYIFRKETLKKILKRNINCFFILRDYQEYQKSLKRYLDVNRINNDFLLQMTEDYFEQAIKFVSNEFLCISFDQIKKDPESAVSKIQEEFNINFGVKADCRVKKNASVSREHFLSSIMHNHLKCSSEYLRSALLGVL